MDEESTLASGSSHRPSESPPDLHNASTKERLEQLYRERSAALAADVVRSGKSPTKQSLEELERLRRLSEYVAPSHPQRHRIQALILLAGTLSLATLLFFLRMPIAQIDLHVITSQAKLVSASSQLALPDMDTVALNLSGIRGVRVPPTRDEPGTWIACETLGLAKNPDARPSVDTEIALASIAISKGARLALKRATPRRLSINLEPPPKEVRVLVTGELVLATESVRKLQSFTPPGEILILTGDEALDLEAQLSSETLESFPPLHVTDVSFEEIDPFGAPGDLRIHHDSGIVSAEIRFPNTGRPALEVLEADFLRIDQVEGSLRLTDSSNSLFDIRLRGEARGVESGSPPSLRSAMPSALDWLRFEHGAALLWAAAVFGLTVLRSVQKWLVLESKER